MHRRLEAVRRELTGRYEIERELGHGVSAVVYLARDLRHERLVAVKVLRRDVSSALSEERFTREIRLAARLQHPHIVPVFDSGSVAGTLFFVMPYVDGDVLRARLQRGLLPVELALRLGVEVADALAYAHTRNVLHRDIKPENILLAGDHALVTDFGVARLMHRVPGDRVTTTGFVLGTPAYMSPEQASGETEVDGRSDQFSLGCVLYELLVGEPPFTGDSARAVIARRFEGPPIPPTTRRPGIPAAVDAILERALAVSPLDRFDNAYELTEVLALAHAQASVRITPKSPAAVAVATGETATSAAAAAPEVPSRHAPSRAMVSAAVVLVLAALVTFAQCAR